VSYRYSFEELLALLHGHAPAKVDAVARHRRRVEHGRLSVGLKVHCLGDGSQFSTLVKGLGGAQKILDINYYKHSHASLCLVLPPVGSARSAILLLECIERFIGSALFMSVSKSKGVASFLAGTRYQSGHLMEFCRKCSLCFRSTAVSWSGNPACSIQEVARDACSSTRLGTHRYSGDDSQSGCGTQANTYSERTRSREASSDPGEGSLKR